jgi:hypothetical protein
VPYPSANAVPAKKVLLALTMAVLIAHWLALGGRIPLWPERWSRTPTEIAALPSTDPLAVNTTPPTATEPPPSALDRPAPVTTSIVRWIAPPAPEPPPAPLPPPPRPKPAKVIKAEVPPKAKAPEPVAPAEVLQAIVESVPAMTEQELLSLLEFEPQPAPAPAPEPETAATATDRPATIETPSPDTAAAPTLSDDTSPRAPSQALQAVSLPPNATLSYDVVGKSKGFNYFASGSLTWQRAGGRYEAQLEVSAFLLGTYVQTSIGQVSPQGLAPERFADKRRSNEKAAHFEPATGRIRYSNNAPDAPWRPGAQDQLSITLQLAGLMNAHSNLKEGQALSMPVSSTGSSEVWRFVVGPIETLQLPAGEVQARLLTRTLRSEYDKTIQLWLAPNLGHLPVRIRQTEHNGDFLDLLLEDLPKIATPPSDSQESKP